MSDLNEKLKFRSKSHKEKVEDLKERISYAEASMESWVSALGKALNALLDFLSRSNKPSLLKIGLRLRDSLLQRYLLQEALLDSQFYFHLTLSKRLVFSKELQANCKTVRQHYYSNCIHYLPDKSKEEIINNLVLKLKMMSEMKKGMEKFDKKVLAKLANSSVDPSERKIKSCFSTLLKMTLKQNSISQDRLEKLLRESQKREAQIASMEGQYFSELSKKLQAETWLSQAEIQKKVDLPREPHLEMKTKDSKKRFECLSCTDKDTEEIEEPGAGQLFQFTLDRDEFQAQVHSILSAEQ